MKNQKIHLYKEIYTFFKDSVYLQAAQFGPLSGPQYPSHKKFFSNTYLPQ